MAKLEQDQQQYRIYRLSDEATQTRLEVVPERGGIIIGWQVQGKELLYLDRDRFADPSLTVRGGIPILFPICGNMPGNTYEYAGQTYELKQHGFARDLPWTVQPNGDERCLVLTLESNEQTRSRYPFDFKLTFTYRLDGNSLVIHQVYENCSAVAMPFATGFHPYFAVMDKSQLRFDIPATGAIDQRSGTQVPFFGSFDFAQDEIDWSFLDLTRQVAVVSDLQQHCRLTLTASELFTTLVFWTLQGKDFYCLEPWSAPRNAINTGVRLQHLAAGARTEATVTMTADF